MSWTKPTTARPRRVQIQRKPLVPLSGFGEATAPWVTTYTVWAEIKTMGGRELTQALQTMAESTTQFVIRYQDDVRAGDRVRIIPTQRTPERLFTINSVTDENEQHQYMILVGKEGSG